MAPAPRTDEESNDESLTNDDHTSFEQTSGGTILAGLSKKKRQYLTQAIEDRSGAYNYAKDPDTYKKARK